MNPHMSSDEGADNTRRIHAYWASVSLHHWSTWTPEVDVAYRSWLIHTLQIISEPVM